MESVPEAPYWETIAARRFVVVDEKGAPLVLLGEPTWEIRPSRLVGARMWTGLYFFDDNGTEKLSLGTSEVGGPEMTFWSGGERIIVMGKVNDRGYVQTRGPEGFTSLPDNSVIEKRG